VAERVGVGLTPRRSLVAGVVALAVLVTAILVHRAGGSDDQRDTVSPTTTTRTSGLDLDALGIEAVQRQAYAVKTHNRAAYLAQSDPKYRPARQQAAMVYDNLSGIPVRDFEVRYLGQSADDATASAEGSWTAEVDVSWRMRGIAGTPTHESVTYTFVRHGHHGFVSRMGAPRDVRTPIWLLGLLEVRRGPRTLVLGLDPARVDRIDRLLRQAVGDVQRVLTGWRGSLVAIVPETSDQVSALLDTQPTNYSGIAAITTAQDGSRGRRNSPVVVVNPHVFDRLGPMGARVVISHESTHVATHANTMTIPLWLAEGFADYVGIAAVHVPPSVAAGQVIAAVRSGRPPRHLPRDADFASGQKDLESAYEMSWLACRLIAATYGTRALVRFYRYVETHPTQVDKAFTSVLHTRKPTFVRAWSQYLAVVANAP
jgi:hypothetical protein